MIVIMKNSKLFIYGLMAVLLLTMAIIAAWKIYYCIKPAPYFINCHATARIKDESKDAHLIIRVTLDHNNKGVIYYSGIVYDEEKKKYTVERDFDVSYSITALSVMTITDLSMTKRYIDTIPDELFKSIVWDVKTNSARFEVKKFENSYVIFNPFSPIMICINLPADSVKK